MQPDFFDILKKARRNTIILYVVIFVIFVVIVFFWFRKKTKIVRSAQKHVGELERTTGSYEVGFVNSDFEKKMRANGFSEGYDWCAIFAKLAVTDTLTGKKLEIVKKLMTPSSQTTYNNLISAAQQYRWIKTSSKPVKGAVVIWQKVENPIYGHVGIVQKTTGKNFQTIEGNVSTGTGYDGVAKKTHTTDERSKTSGLRLRDKFIKIT